MMENIFSNFFACLFIVGQNESEMGENFDVSRGLLSMPACVISKPGITTC
jgi:hypothetical protein